MAVTVNIQEAQTNLSKLLASLHSGNEIIIANRGLPVARLTPYRERSARPTGFVKGSLPASFFDDMPEEELKLWGM
ncbi:MAG: type II toxin-antitoxin system prevent-host-death family antitoxin [Clostridiales bacterium]|jgi:prevent-host-death family protein|nr:type II toxin-antitoxin system prevent-host-death family antitoxin [Clostridiales bacterium]